MFARSFWQISLRRRGEVKARVVEVARMEAREPALGEVIDVQLPDRSTIRAKIMHIVRLPPLDGDVRTLRFEVTTEEA